METYYHCINCKFIFWMRIWTVSMAAFESFKFFACPDNDLCFAISRSVLLDIVPKDHSVFGQHNLWCIRHASQKCMKVKNIYNHSKCPLIHDDRDHIFVTTFVATLIRCFIFCIVLILLVSTDFLPQDWIQNRLLTSHIILRHQR